MGLSNSKALCQLFVMEISIEKTAIKVKSVPLMEENKRYDPCSRRASSEPLPRFDEGD